jgi:hypothetical protein
MDGLKAGGVSTEQFIVCDKCGDSVRYNKDADEGAPTDGWRTAHLMAWGGEGSSYFLSLLDKKQGVSEFLHLCPACYELLKTWLKVGTGVKS